MTHITTHPVISAQLARINKTNAEQIYAAVYKRLERELKRDRAQHRYPKPIMWDWRTLGSCRPHTAQILLTCIKHM